MSREPTKKESKVEAAKRAGRRLRGAIAETLHSDASHFSEDDYQLLKFHGVYQQYDRDTASARRDARQEPDYSFMIRATIPGGALTADQYLKLDELADDVGGGSLRLTTRQSVQYHGVAKGDLRRLIAGVHEKLLTTLAACGDVERNVMAAPAPLADADSRLAQQLAREIASELAPKTKAYHEIWLGGEKVVSTEEDEPFYGDQYLPRKFKTGVTVAGDNSIDVYTYDCGLVIVAENGRVKGVQLLVGGGMGMQHNRGDTFAALAQPLGFVAPQHAVEAVRAVVAVFRDNGNRADRKHARLKYLIHEWGLERFRDEFKRRINFDVADPVELPTPKYRDYVGAHAQGDGRFFYGVFVQSGRLIDRDESRIKSALRAVVEQHRPNIRLAPNQNLLLTDLDEAALPVIEQTLRDHGVTPGAELSGLRRYSMACPALPTCGLALTESERAIPYALGRFEVEFEKLGLLDEPLTLRMTGCPNGCARPYTADIAFVGRKPGEKYNLYVGGGLAGDRVADLYAEDVTIDEAVELLRPLLTHFARDRRGDEGFSDFYQRLTGATERRQKLTGKEEAMSPRLALPVLP